MNDCTLPTRPQFKTTYAFDERASVDAFFKKTLQEVESLFARSFLWYSEQLSVTATVPFEFYVVAACSYLQGASSTGDPDAVNGFCFLLEHRLAVPSLQIPASSKAGLIETIQVILQQIDRYDVDLAIYGDLAARLTVLANRLAA